MKIENQAENCCLIVGEGVTINGKIVAPGPVRVLGNVKGELSASDICVAPGGRVEGRMLGRNLDLSGHVSEAVSASGHLRIRTGATVRADILYQTLEIEGGANIEGSLKCQDQPRPQPQGDVTGFAAAAAPHLNLAD
ncbi:MAG: hypothetical protein RJA36_3851 [Pseudomonadota bacterium]|jgi:cytoskeletal protein CcmA (bactofilin family)